MEVTALCTRLLMNVLLLVAQLHLTDSAADFPLVDPNRQQLFKDESFSVSCEGLDGLTGWRVMRKVKGVIKTCASTWETSTGRCQITNAYPEFDSGEYWCEIGAKKSDTVNITVTAGSVILESPVLPVTEGENVTLRCSNKKTSSDLTAQFYKDDDLMGSSSTGEMTLYTVSKSAEGLYKCSLSGSGESAESWLAVRASSLYQSFQLALLLCVGVSLVLVYLLLLVGLLRCRKRQTIITDNPTSPSSVHSASSPQTQTVLGRTSDAEPIQEATYALVTKPRREKVLGRTNDAEPIQEATYALITKPRREEDPGLSGCSETPNHF